MAAAILPAILLAGCQEERPPSDEELVRSGAQMACLNFDRAEARLVRDGTSPADDPVSSGRLDNAIYGAATIAETDGAYVAFRDGLEDLRRAVDAGDAAVAEEAAEKLRRICEPIERGDFPEPQPGAPAG